MFPVRSLQILDGIDPAHLQEREQDVEGGDNVLVAVAAVVDDEIEAALVLMYPLKQCRVVLTALVDPDAFFLERCLVVIVEANNLCLWKIFFPHPKRLAALGWIIVAADADLKDGYIVELAEAAEVVVVVAGVLVAWNHGAVGANCGMGRLAVFVCAMLDCKFYKGRFLCHCRYD